MGWTEGIAGHLPAEEAAGSALLGEVARGTPRRVAVAARCRRCVIQLQQLVQEVYLRKHE